VSNFRYAAKDPSGKTIEGVIEADDRGSALADLRSRNLVVLQIEDGGRAAAGGKKAKGKAKAKAMSAGGGGGRSLLKRQPSATKTELVLFTRQLATMIGAGISLLEALEVLGEQAETPGLTMTCELLASELRAGSDLSSAMQLCPKAFSPLYVSMVSAGEVSGQMEIILERLADYQEDSEALTREIKSAMTYPVISLVLVLGITAFLMLGVVPTFREIFESLDAELPGITLAVLNTSEWMRGNWMVMLIAMVVGTFGFFAMKKNERGALILDHVSLKLPVFGMLTRKICLARFSRTFATLIRSGVPIMGTLDIVAATAGNRVLSNAVDESKESVRNGNMLSEPLADSPVFPPMVVRMIAIGERSGALETLLEKIADFYDSQVKSQVKSLTSMIEPLLIGFMGIIVGGVVLAIFMPILNVVGNLSGQ
jgi:type IV pilus assembly protein PilC